MEEQTMAKRSTEPEEALGPAVDGWDQIERLERAVRPAFEPEPEIEPEPAPEPEAPITLLICGRRTPALECARLAVQCGFRLELAEREELPPEDELAQIADQVHILPDYENLVQDCSIDRDHYVCVFVDDAHECEQILMQCLPSDAAYIGAWAGNNLSREIFSALKQDGAPDAELAAICCPMGLGIGSSTPDQDAVAVVAEILAARSGVLKRLRFSN